MKTYPIRNALMAMVALGWASWCFAADPHGALIDSRASLAEKSHPGLTDFFAAAEALQAGQVDDCMAGLNKAIAADGQRPLYHLARGGLLVVTGRSADAQADLVAGSKWDCGGFLAAGAMGQSEAVMWDATIDKLAGRAPAPQMGRVQFRFTPNFPLEDAVQKWISAGGGAGPEQTSVMHHMAVRWQTVPDALPLLLKKAHDLMEEGNVRSAMPLLRDVGVVQHDDNVWLAVDADAHLSMGCWATARQEYDKLLIHEPENPYAYLGHALACAHIGSFSQVHEDLAEAGMLNAGLTATFHQQHDAELALMESALPKEDPAALSKQLLAAAQGGEDDEKLAQRAFTLRTAVNIRRRVPQERYINGVRKRLNAIDLNPKDAAGRADMATYIYSEALDKYGHGTPNELEWEADRIAAMTDADAALKLDPQNITAMSTKGWLLEEDNQEKDALDLAQAGLQVEPGYPRLANLQYILLQVSALRADQAAGKLRAPKSGMIFTPDAIITWTRGPNDAELAQARQYASMSGANVATASAGLVEGWRKYRDDVEQMDVIADYLDSQGRQQDAINLWKKVLTIDPDNVTALGDLEDVYKDAHLADDELEMEFRLDNVFATSATAMLQKASADLKAQDTAGAQAALDRALATDPADARVWVGLADLNKSDRAAAEAYLRSASALVEAGLRFNGLSAATGAPGWLAASDSQYLVSVLSNVAQYAGNSADADRTNRQIADIKRRIALGENYQGAQDNGWSLNVARLQWESQLIANNEMHAAALFCLQVPNRTGSWHGEAGRDEFKIEYPVYRFLAPRLYHFQLWHFFGPGTLQSYEASANNDANAPPAYHPPNAAE